MKTPKELALLAARALSDKKGKEIQALEIADLTTLADYFVLATGSSNTQINALVDNVEKVLHEEAGEEPLHREGYRGGTWVLLDYGCIAVHVFNHEAREFYGLERLWRQAAGSDRRYRRAGISEIDKASGRFQRPDAFCSFNFFLDKIAATIVVHSDT